MQEMRRVLQPHPAGWDGPGESREVCQCNVRPGHRLGRRIEGAAGEMSIRPEKKLITYLQRLSRQSASSSCPCPEKNETRLRDIALERRQHGVLSFSSYFAAFFLVGFVFEGLAFAVFFASLASAISANTFSIRRI